MSRGRLVVLGCSGTHIGRKRMCSSYLLEADGFRLLLDCGNGSLSRLQRCVDDVAEVDALLISHLHVDHFADLYSLYYALRFHPGGPRSLPVYAPPGASAHIAQLVDDGEMLARTCRFHPARAGEVLELGPLRVSLHPAAHPVETLAARIEGDGWVVAYSADSGPSPAIVTCARDADLFLCDASWLERQRPLPADLHMTGREAGEHAARAGARRLVVTHVFPANEPEEVAAEARAVHDGDVLTAADLQEHPL